MRQDQGLRGESRSSALWGRRGETRKNALWGKGGRGRLAMFALVAALAAPLVASASDGNTGKGASSVFVSPGLIAQAQANPDQLFHVIVQGTRDAKSSDVAHEVGNENGQSHRSFASISGVAADLTGKQVLKLARHPHIAAITQDLPVKTSGYVNSLMWRDTADLTPLDNTLDPATGAILGPAPQAPAIAIVDSGVDPNRSDEFGTRLIASVNLSSLSPNATGDDEGHGTMVAGIAAGSSAAYPGAAQNAPLVSIRTADAQGQSMTSDVIAAADWIVANAQKYNIRVANFSMAGGDTVSFRNDPLDRAVESLWFHGIVVVAAAGNHGTGPVDMSHDPGNDPFVISVGATDQNQTADPLDDTVPYWSAYGYTMDGFARPDVSAPGRYMISAIPMASTIATTVPGRIVAPGFIWMSGTSFSTPVVSGAAAQILARHPDWTPDQVKGALMLTANALPAAGSFSAGVGEIDAAAAAAVTNPPDPNENLKAYKRSDAQGNQQFDAAGWASAVGGQAGWAQANWTSAGWSTAGWSTAGWSAAGWSSSTFSASLTGKMGTLATYSE